MPPLIDSELILFDGWNVKANARNSLIMPDLSNVFTINEHQLFVWNALAFFTITNQPRGSDYKRSARSTSNTNAMTPRKGIENGANGQRVRWKPEDKTAGTRDENATKSGRVDGGPDWKELDQHLRQEIDVVEKDFGCCENV